jgi:DNA mismatch repair protein MSH3
MRIATYLRLGILSLGAFYPNFKIRTQSPCPFRTKFVTRYHTPDVKTKLQERAQYKEALEAEATKAFSTFLGEIAQGHYGVLRNAVNNLAIADCLLSFARVALQEGYVRPEFTEDDTLEIVDGVQ